MFERLLSGRERFEIYMAMRAVKIGTMRPVTQVVERIIMSLPSEPAV